MLHCHVVPVVHMQLKGTIRSVAQVAVALMLQALHLLKRQ
jgi:hypothetical protein